MIFDNGDHLVHSRLPRDRGLDTGTRTKELCMKFAQ